MNEEKENKFNCKRCGECCKRFYVLDEFSEEEWVAIIEYLHKYYNGVLTLDYEGEILRFNMDSIEDIKKARRDQNDLFWAIDGSLCPFLKQSKDNTYFCEIQDIKPIICKVYRCDIDPESHQNLRDGFKEAHLKSLRRFILKTQKYSSVFKRYFNDLNKTSVESLRDQLLFCWNWDFGYINDLYEITQNSNINNMQNLIDLIDEALNDENFFSLIEEYKYKFNMGAIEEIFKKLNLNFKRDF